MKDFLETRNKIILSEKKMSEITVIIISAVISLIISIIAVYVSHTTLGCYLGIHHYKQEGMATRTPIEYHMICLRCGQPKTVYRKEK